MIPNLDKILKEWSYRVGVIDYKDDAHLYHLNKILEERGWSQKIMNEFINNINNETITEATYKDVRNIIVSKLGSRLGLAGPPTQKI